MQNFVPENEKLQGVAVKAMKEMHQIVHEGLEDVAEFLLAEIEPGTSRELTQRLNRTLHHTAKGIEGMDLRKVKTLFL
jgi:hypothetical protein